MPTILENRAVRNGVLPISVEQYHALTEAGIIPEKTELLRGVIVAKTTKTPLHTWTVRRLVEWFDLVSGPSAYLVSRGHSFRVDSLGQRSVICDVRSAIDAMLSG